jgi:hypothetical protein
VIVQDEFKRIENQALLRLAAWLRARGYTHIPPELFAILHSLALAEFELGWGRGHDGLRDDEPTRPHVRITDDLDRL